MTPFEKGYGCVGIPMNSVDNGKNIDADNIHVAYAERWSSERIHELCANNVARHDIANYSEVINIGGMPRIILEETKVLIGKAVSRYGKSASGIRHDIRDGDWLFSNAMVMCVNGVGRVMEKVRRCDWKHIILSPFRNYSEHITSQVVKMLMPVQRYGNIV